MEKVNDILTRLLAIIVGVINLILAGLAAVETWCHGQLTLMGVGPQLQSVILVALAVILFLAALRLFDGLLRLFLVVVLALIALHIVMPAMHI